jgi:predicted nuclease with TOPRIM domain
MSSSRLLPASADRFAAHGILERLEGVSVRNNVIYAELRRINDRIDRLDVRMDRLDERMDRLDRQIAQLDRQIDHLDGPTEGVAVHADTVA